MAQYIIPSLKDWPEARNRGQEMETIITGHEAEMAALAEQEHRPLTPADMVQRVLWLARDLPAVGEETLFGEMTTKADVQLAMERLASMATHYAKLLAD